MKGSDLPSLLCWHILRLIGLVGEDSSFVALLEFHYCTVDYASRETVPRTRPFLSFNSTFSVNL